MSKETETTKNDALVAQFRFAMIAPVIQGLFPDASATAYYKRVTEHPLTLPNKLHLAGAPDSIIETAALSAVHSYTQGNPRLIDNLMTDALMIGSQLEKTVIDAEVIHDAVENQGLY